MEEKSTVERILEEIRKVKKDELINPSHPKKKNELGIGTVGIFAKQAYTYWQRLITEIDEIGTKMQQRMNSREERILSEQKALLIEKTLLVKKMFWFEANNNCNAWGYKDIGIRKGFEVVVRPSNPFAHVCVTPIPISPQAAEFLMSTIGGHKPCMRGEELKFFKNILNNVEEELFNGIKNDFFNGTLPDEDEIH